MHSSVSVCLILLIFSTAYASNFPKFMKNLYYESEKSLENINTIENGAFQPVVRSYIPTFTTAEENGEVEIAFAIPYDEWNRNTEELNWWIVFSLKHKSSSYKLKLTHKQDTEIHTITRVIKPKQKFAVFNISSLNLNLEFNRSFTLFLMAEKNNENLLTKNHVTLNGIQNGPLLIISSENLIKRAARHSRRPRRNIVYQNQPREIAQTCNLMEWSINSEDITWEWVVYPSRISFNLCVGSCPLPYLHRSLNPTQHAVARNMLRITRHNSTYLGFQPAIQCVPVEYRRVSLLIKPKGNDNFALVTSHDLSAALCGCR